MIYIFIYAHIHTYIYIAINMHMRFIYDYMIICAYNIYRCWSIPTKLSSIRIDFLHMYILPFWFLVQLFNLLL